MSRWLVMPRGINVGKNHRVPMADLRKELSAAGYADVVTIGQSGNIIVTRHGTEGEIAAAVRQLLVNAFAVDVPVVVRHADEVRDVLASNPLGGVATDGSKYLAIFLSAAPPFPETGQNAASDATIPSDLAGGLVSGATDSTDPEVVQYAGRTVFVWHPDGVLAMKTSHASLEKRFGITATARNWNTLVKVAAKL
ncbi:MAG: DUF1697 domain-containing protein [Propionibacteriaceae bacterium]|nr:DUF1697 domain-containing protein [Propionibacteriaceae bacterium]